jgi:hypothetical protein
VDAHNSQENVDIPQSSLRISTGASNPPRRYEGFFSLVYLATNNKKPT